MGVLRSALKSSRNQLQQIRNRVPEVVYDLRDDFLAPLLPGAVNGTDAEPGPGTRAVTDTGNLLDIGRGSLSLHAPAGFGDPGIWYEAVTREAGRMLKIMRYSAAYLGNTDYGWDVNTNGSVAAHAANYSIFFSNSVNILGVFDGAINEETGNVFALRANGCFAFQYVDGIWKLCFITADESTTTLYPGITCNGTDLDVPYVAVPKKLWLPTPLLSDGFAAANEPDAVDYGGVSNGDYTRTGLRGDAKRAFFDGTNSYCNIQSADYSNKLNGAEGTVIQKLKVASAAVWTDGVVRAGILLQVDAGNLITMLKLAPNNLVYYQYVAGGVNISIVSAAISTTSDFTMGQTWSASADEFKGFTNGIQEGLTQNGLGVWGGPPVTDAVIGATSIIGPATPWEGTISDTINLYGVVATPAQMLEMHTMLLAGTMTEEYLNSTFGAGTWSWWKLNESFSSDGEGHAEGVAGGIGSGGEGLLYEQPYGAFDYLGNTFHCSLVESGDAIAVADCKSSDVIVTGDLIWGAGLVGVIARYTDINNYVLAYHNGGSAVLYEYVGGVGNLILSAGAAPGAGNPIRLILDGQNAGLYYNNVLIGTGLIDADLPAGTKCGSYSSAVDNTVDNLTVYARGTNGEYELLEEF